MFILPWAVPSIPTILSLRFMLNPEWGIINQIIFRLTFEDGPNWLNDPAIALSMSILVHIWKSLPFWTLILLAARLAIPDDLYEAASVDGASSFQKFRFVTWPSMQTLYITCTILSMIWTLGDFNSVYLLTGGGPGDLTHVLATLGIRYSAARSGRSVDGRDRGRAADGAAAGVLHDEAAVAMNIPSLRAITTEAKLLLVGIPVFIWTMLPIYHLFLFSISPKESAFAGKLWPDHPTLQNFRIVFKEQHFYLHHFWEQMWNSVVIAVATGVHHAADRDRRRVRDRRLKVKGGRWVMNLALFTYFIPAAFLAVPMYRTMGIYGLLNSHWALILAMVTIASPYAIWVLKQASDKLPLELDEAAIMDGASPMQLFRLVYIPLMLPTLVAVGIYALLLAWNEYLYAFLLLSKDSNLTLSVALGNFLAADDSPWELLMTTGLIYALPPAAIYYVFRRYMVSGLTAGAVKS